MLSELLRKEYKVKKNFIELERSNYAELKDTLCDNFTDSKEGETLETRISFRDLNSEAITSIERIIKDFDHLVYFTNVEDQCAVLVYFEGDISNELINKHNEKVLTFIKRLSEINGDLDFRYKLVKNHENFVKKELELGNMYPNTYTIVLKDLLNELLNKSNYVFGGTYDERTNIVLYTDPDFNKVSWSLAQRKDLMRSLFLDLPIGYIYMNTFDYFKLSNNTAELLEFDHIDNIVYDGKNRLSTILYFLLGVFSVDFDGEEYFVGNLSKATLTQLLNKKVTIYETDFETKEELLDFYNLINVTNKD